MEQRGLTRAELTRRAGVNSTMLHDILTRGQTPSVKNLEKLASALGVRLVDLFDLDRNNSPTLQLSGCVAEGDVWKKIPSDDNQITLDLFSSDLVSIEVRTNDLAPTYRRGDVLCGPKSVGRHVDNHVGTDCIIKLINGERMVRTLHKGSAPGRYTLRSLDRTQPDIPDAAPEWVAPIRMIIRHQR